MTDQRVRVAIVFDECMKCGRPWDGMTLLAAYTKAWCPRCEEYQRFQANTYVPKAERDRLKEALVPFRVLADASDAMGHFSDAEWVRLKARVLRNAANARAALDEERQP